MKNECNFGLRKFLKNLRFEKITKNHVRLTIFLNTDNNNLLFYLFTFSFFNFFYFFNT